MPHENHGQINYQAHTVLLGSLLRRITRLAALPFTRRTGASVRTSRTRCELKIRFTTSSTTASSLVRSVISFSKSRKVVLIAIRSLRAGSRAENRLFFMGLSFSHYPTSTLDARRGGKVTRNLMVG